MGETIEGARGSDLKVREGADGAGKVADLAGDMGEWGGRERGGFKLNPAHSRARVGAGEAGEGRRREREVWARSGGATWSGEGGKRRRRGGFGGSGGWSSGSNGRRNSQTFLQLRDVEHIVDAKHVGGKLKLTSLVTVIVREFSIRQAFVPCSTKVKRTGSQHIL
uniref:Retrotransposon protein, putative, Ty3-gypsy subclass n=1 Tax=Oryza sativa subsp. japonica TaxID=39947 RepID=Q2QUA6_ORYSJ|nr:retrotransposon protein, putative, Ty3-gypsy subclass [Oryza sativa Japonica Group]